MSTLIVDDYLQYLNTNKNDYIQEIEMITENISLDKLKSFGLKYINQMREILKSVGLSPVEIENYGKSFSKKATKLFEDGKKPEEASKILVKLMVNKITHYLKKAKQTYDNKVDKFAPWQKVVISIGMTIILASTNGLILGLLGNILGPEMGFIFLAIVIGPMLEEALKNWFIQNNMPWIGTGVVFGLELVSYVMRITAAGGSLPKALLLRLMGLLMHFSTTLIQKYIIDKADEENKTKYLFMAWVAGCSIHMTTNLLALIYGGDISLWMRK